MLYYCSSCNQILYFLSLVFSAYLLLSFCLSHAALETQTQLIQAEQVVPVLEELRLLIEPSVVVSFELRVMLLEIKLNRFLNLLGIEEIFD